MSTESEEKGAGLELSLEEMGGDTEPGQTAGGGEGWGRLLVLLGEIQTGMQDSPLRSHGNGTLTWSKAGIAQSYTRC